MESDKKLEIIEKAVRKLIEEEEINATSVQTSLSKESFVDKVEGDNEKTGGRRHQHQLLSKLLSELEESLEQEKIVTQEADVQEDKIDESNGIRGSEEIVKELNKVKKQNLITHCLLTVMIVLTVAWQLSEVSLILKIKDGLSNPLRSVGGILGGFFKNRPSVNVVQDVIKQASEMQKHVTEPTYLPGLKIPDLPHLELPGFDTTDDDDEQE
ncbi:hypothetical protein Salat_1978200 [Sesamum alatum]|uniref:Uncharacterized protein n=1 Tax=Sesamum alatum TaxID=300844 RepID=A0AAE1Y5C6_9LAMI|nr:hypothetical protein Salat_1978200 [Sesamum alatum]